MINSVNIKYARLSILVITTIIEGIYISFTDNIKFYTTVGKNGHLVWEFLNYKHMENVFFAVFILLYIIPYLLVDNTLLKILLISALLASLVFYHKYKTWGTMWCWGSNLFLLYFIMEILLIKPFYEYNSLC
jgi:hypothetical protein